MVEPFVSIETQTDSPFAFFALHLQAVADAPLSGVSRCARTSSRAGVGLITALGGLPERHDFRLRYQRCAEACPSGALALRTARACDVCTLTFYPSGR